MSNDFFSFVYTSIAFSRWFSNQVGLMKSSLMRHMTIPQPREAVNQIQSYFCKLCTFKCQIPLVVTRLHGIAPCGTSRYLSLSLVCMQHDLSGACAPDDPHSNVWI
jgi:hypothetical protein